MMSLSVGQWDGSTVYKHPHDGIDTDSMTAQCPDNNTRVHTRQLIRANNKYL